MKKPNFSLAERHLKGQIYTYYEKSSISGLPQKPSDRDYSKELSQFKGRIMDARASHFNMGTDQSHSAEMQKKPNTGYKPSFEEFKKNMTLQKTCNVHLGGQSDMNAAGKMQSTKQTFFRWIQPKIEWLFNLF